MNDKVNINGVEYNKLEIVSIEVDGKEKDKVTFEETEKKDRIIVDIVVNQIKNGN